MSCTCAKNQDRSGNNVSPYEYCPFCAEKHLSTVFGEFQQDKNRQLMIGELNCARLHLANKTDLLSKIDSILECRFEGTTLANIEEIITMNDAIIEEELVKATQADDGKKSNVFPEYASVPTGQSLLLSERSFCTAWRFAEECGYITINRNYIIEKLTLAQLYYYLTNYDLAKEIRDVRHLIQYRKETEIGDKWLTIANEYEAEYAKSIQNS